jgi:hypothetical protein
VHKLGILRGTTDDDEPFVYPGIWQQQETSGPDRFLIGPAKDHLGLLLDLSTCLKGPFRLLYVLLVSRRYHEPGRYASPPGLQAGDLRSFCNDFREYLEVDGRHHLWVVSESGGGTLVYDQHNVIFAYGPLEGYEEILRGRGLRPGTVTYPTPHCHHYHPEHDDSEDRILRRWAWAKTPLQDGDQQ